MLHFENTFWKTSPMKKFFFALLFVLWLTVILTLFFVVQKPDFLNILAGLKNLLFINTFAKIR